MPKRGWYLRLLIWLLRRHPDTCFVDVTTYQELEASGVHGMETHEHAYAELVLH